MRRILIDLSLAGIALFYLALIAHMQLLAALWIPSLMLLFLVAFPALAVIGENSLFRGLFDLDLSPRARLPIRLFLATFTAFAVAGSAMCIVQLALYNGPARLGIPHPRFWPWLAAWIEFGSHPATGALLRLMAELSALAAWVAGLAIFASWRQDRRRSLGRMIAGTLTAIAVGDLGVLALARVASGWIQSIAKATVGYKLVQWLGDGYTNQAWAGHVAAAFAALVTGLLYIALGFYGRRALGKQNTIPSLVAPMMAVLVLGWIGSALEVLAGGVAHSPVAPCRRSGFDQPHSARFGSHLSDGGAQSGCGPVALDSPDSPGEKVRNCGCGCGRRHPIGGLDRAGS